MPGVVVTTGAVAGPSAPTRAPSSQFFCVGLAERGPTGKALLVNSLADFNAAYGGQTSYGALYDALTTYFQEGGSRAYVARVVGPSATTGTLAGGLLDGASSPVATLNVSAANPGSWSSNVSVQVLAGSSASTFRLQVFYSGVLTEDYTNLGSPQEAVSKVNSRSVYIMLADAGSPTAAPANNPAPTGSPGTLSAGADDRSHVVTQTYLSALSLFPVDFGDGAVAIPGAGSSVHAGLIGHADAYNRIALLAAERGADKNTLIGYASNLNAKRAGLFAPWVQVPDGFGGTKAISPEAFVAAARSKAHNQAGPWKAAAGGISTAIYVVAPDQVFTVTDSNDLDSAKVDVIRTIAGTVRLYGWRSLSADFDNWAYLTGADTVNRYVTEATVQLEQYVFGVIDSSGHLLATIKGTLVGIAKPMADANGLFAAYDPTTGALIDPGYAVDTGSTLNTVASLALNQVLATVSLRVSPTGATVSLSVTKAGVTAAL
jgi:phage tail sheath protein FI